LAAAHNPGQHRIQVTAADEPPNRANEVGMVAKGDDTLSRENCLDVEMKAFTPSEGLKKGRMLTPGQYFRPPNTPGEETGLDSRPTSAGCHRLGCGSAGTEMSVACVYGERAPGSSPSSEQESDETC
jgi:hypothetical protein